jgi:hypothetical protein
MPNRAIRSIVVADPGWITGQSYMICASTDEHAAPASSLEGSPVFPSAGRFASIIERNTGVQCFQGRRDLPQNGHDRPAERGRCAVSTICQFAARLHLLR